MTEDRTEDRVESKTEDGVESRVEDRTEDRVESKTEDGVEDIESYSLPDMPTIYGPLDNPFFGHAQDLTPSAPSYTGSSLSKLDNYIPDGSTFGNYISSLGRGILDNFWNQQPTTFAVRAWMPGHEFRNKQREAADVSLDTVSQKAGFLTGEIVGSMFSPTTIALVSLMGLCPPVSGLLAARMGFTIGRNFHRALVVGRHVTVAGTVSATESAIHRGGAHLVGGLTHEDDLSDHFLYGAAGALMLLLPHQVYKGIARHLKTPKSPASFSAATKPMTQYLEEVKVNPLKPIPEEISAVEEARYAYKSKLFLSSREDILDTPHGIFVNGENFMPSFDPMHETFRTYLPKNTRKVSTEEMNLLSEAEALKRSTEYRKKTGRLGPATGFQEGWDGKTFDDLVHNNSFKTDIQKMKETLNSISTEKGDLGYEPDPHMFGPKEELSPDRFRDLGHRLRFEGDFDGFDYKSIDISKPPGIDPGTPIRSMSPDNTYGDSIHYEDFKAIGGERIKFTPGEIKELRKRGRVPEEFTYMDFIERHAKSFERGDHWHRDVMNQLVSGSKKSTFYREAISSPLVKRFSELKEKDLAKLMKDEVSHKRILDFSLESGWLHADMMNGRMSSAEFNQRYSELALKLSPDEHKTARALKNLSDNLWRAQNDLGIDIGYRLNHLPLQMMDPLKVAKFSDADWLAFGMHPDTYNWNEIAKSLAAERSIKIDKKIAKNQEEFDKKIENLKKSHERQKKSIKGEAVTALAEEEKRMRRQKLTPEQMEKLMENVGQDLSLKETRKIEKLEKTHEKEKKAIQDEALANLVSEEGKLKKQKEQIEKSLEGTVKNLSLKETRKLKKLEKTHEKEKQAIKDETLANLVSGERKIEKQERRLEKSLEGIEKNLKLKEARKLKNLEKTHEKEKQAIQDETASAIREGKQLPPEQFEKALKNLEKNLKLKETRKLEKLEKTHEKEKQAIRNETASDLSAAEKKLGKQKTQIEKALKGLEKELDLKEAKKLEKLEKTHEKEKKAIKDEALANLSAAEKKLKKQERQIEKSLKEIEKNLSLKETRKLKKLEKTHEKEKQAIQDEALANLVSEEGKLKRQKLTPEQMEKLLEDFKGDLSLKEAKKLEALDREVDAAKKSHSKKQEKLQKGKKPVPFSEKDKKNFLLAIKQDIELNQMDSQVKAGSKFKRRILHYASGESQLEAMKRYTRHENIFDAVSDYVKNSGARLATYSTLGPDPSSASKRLLNISENFTGKWKGDDFLLFNSKGLGPMLEEMVNPGIGHDHIMNTKGRIYERLKDLVVATKIANTFMYNFAEDTIRSVGVANNFGYSPAGYISGITDFFRNLIVHNIFGKTKAIAKGMKLTPKNKEELAFLGLATEKIVSMRNQSMINPTTGNRKPGVTDWVLKYSGADSLQRSTEMGLALTWQREMAKMLKKPWDKVPRDFKKHFTGINENDWDLVRKLQPTAEVRGVKFFSVGDAYNVNIDSNARRILAKLNSGMHKYINEVSPKYERMISRAAFGGKPDVGTFRGMMLDSYFTFKSSLWTLMWNWASYQSRWGPAVKVLVSSFVSGLILNTIDDLSRGEYVDWEDMDQLERAEYMASNLVRGGGLGGAYDVGAQGLMHAYQSKGPASKAISGLLPGLVADQLLMTVDDTNKLVKDLGKDKYDALPPALLRWVPGGNYKPLRWIIPQSLKDEIVSALGGSPERDRDKRRARTHKQPLG